MQMVIYLLGLLLAVSLPLQADTNSLLPVQDVLAAEAPVDSDSKKLMQELCESYANDEGLQGSEREANINTCLISMTTDLSDIATTANALVEPNELPIDEVATHPEVLIANELVDQPLPGSEELITNTPIKTD